MLLFSISVFVERVCTTKLTDMLVNLDVGQKPGWSTIVSGYNSTYVYSQITTNL